MAWRRSARGSNAGGVAKKHEAAWRQHVNVAAKRLARHLATDNVWRVMASA